MILYLAGSLAPVQFLAMADRAGAKNFLFTFADKQPQQCAIYCVEQRRTDLRLFIDSGAFTAWKQGTPIDLNDYIDFAKEIKKKAICPVTFAALDVIAGSTNGATQEQHDDACSQGWKNYLAMKEQGIQSVPTFHQDDPWKWLDILADDTDHIAVAPRKRGKSDTEKMRWLNECHRRLGKRSYDGSLRIHGLGISSPVFMETYPFYSVDSTAWLWSGGKTGSYRYFDGRSAPSVPRSELDDRIWKPRPVYDSTIDPSGLQALNHYLESADGSKDRKIDPYWLSEQSMRQDVRLGEYITAHWKHRGVTWDGINDCGAQQSQASRVEVVG